MIKKMGLIKIFTYIYLICSFVIGGICTFSGDLLWNGSGFPFMYFLFLYIILPIVIFMDFFFVSEVPLWKCILYILPMAVFLISLTHLFTLCYLALVIIFYIFMLGLMVLGAKGRGHRRVNSFGRYFTLIYIFLEYIVLFQAILFGLEPAIAETVILMLTLPEVMCFDFKLFGKVNVKKAVFCLLPVVFVLLIYFYILHIYV